MKTKLFELLPFLIFGLLMAYAVLGVLSEPYQGAPISSGQ